MNRTLTKRPARARVPERRVLVKRPGERIAAQHCGMWTLGPRPKVGHGLLVDRRRLNSACIGEGGGELAQGHWVRQAVLVGAWSSQLNVPNLKTASLHKINTISTEEEETEGQAASSAAMAPTLRERKQGGQGTEKTVGKRVRRVSPGRRVSVNRTSTKRPARARVPERRALVQRPGERIAQHNGMWTFAELFGSASDYLTEPGDSDEDDDVPANRPIRMEDFLAKKAECKVKCAKALKRINTFLGKKKFSAENPYKDAIEKLLRGEDISRGVREKIFNYIEEKLMMLKQCLSELCGIENWDNTAAGHIVDMIKEVKDDLGVEVTELKEISRGAESIRTEPERVFKIAKGEYVKDLVRSWCLNGLFSSRIAELWVDKPTASFSSVDPEEFNDVYLGRWVRNPEIAP